MTWKQLPLKMESTLRLSSSGSACWLTELSEGPELVDYICNVSGVC